MNQQDKYESNQKFKRGSTEIQKFYDGRLVLEASKEVERSCIFKTNNLLMNAGTSLDEKVVAIKGINEYGCDQEEILDYFSWQKVECSAQLEMKEFDKEELLQGIGKRNCWRSRWNPIDRVRDELPNRVDTLKDQRQNRVWNPEGSKSSGLVAIALLQKSDRTHREESMETSLHGESNAGASYLGFIKILCN